MVQSPTITVTAAANGDNGNGDNGNGDEVRFPLIQGVLDRVRDRLDSFLGE